MYDLYAADGSAAGFDSQPKKGVDPQACGWKRIARVDTRPQQGASGGQYGVSISDSGGVLGRYRYLLFDICLEKKIAEEAAEATRMNTLTDEEKAVGWKLLFNGRNLAGWHDFRREDVRPGWQVRDGVLVCADPHDAGDLCTEDQFAWFELQLEYNISPAGNSGIMYHVTDEAHSAWATGPEFQLEDNASIFPAIGLGR